VFHHFFALAFFLLLCSFQGSGWTIFQLSLLLATTSGAGLFNFDSLFGLTFGSVEVSGLEPLTSALQRQRSTN
jgi:hypothetical protein